MTRIPLVLAFIAAVLPFDRRPARADEKPWCMNVEGSERCYFDSAEQCGQAASAGSRGLCHHNPWYHGAQPRQETPRRRRH